VVPLNGRLRGQVSLRDATYLIAVECVAHACRERERCDMNPYLMLGCGLGTNEATSLSARLSAWHDAMVAHERRLRTGRTSDVCDDDCPHAEARALWSEAMTIFGSRAHELTFLRSRASESSRRAKAGAAAQEPISEAADTARASSHARETHEHRARAASSNAIRATELRS
jgi:hypothetical protein